MAAQATSYDLVPYESFPFPDTHPDRLAALGRMFGLQPPLLDNCRVLELGCASGGNLIPMALSMPDAEFVGVDLSEVQVNQGLKVIAKLGLTNIRLLVLSITDVDESFGQFDYIITHGVYSWVPTAVQEKILTICAEQLSPNGIAYVSYNTLPGWRMRGMIRDAMRYHAMQFDDPAQRVAQARAILDFLAKWVPAENNAYGMLLKAELDVLRSAADYYILHEHLEDINEPIYFHEFAERAARHGLQYLAEANFSSMLASNLPQEVTETLVRIAPDTIRQEQFMDFLRNRTFRQTLLVHKDVSINRFLTPDCVTSLWVSTDLVPVNADPELLSQREELFRCPRGGMVQTPNAVTKAALVLLAPRWPGWLSFQELLGMAIGLLGQEREITATPGQSAETVLASDLLQCYTVGLVEFHAGPAPFVTQPSQRPHASPLARRQAGQGSRQVTTLRHELALIEAHQGRLLQLLDGTRTREEIYEAARDMALSELESIDTKGPAKPIQEQVDNLLAKIAHSALLRA
jgi:methyltransferase-like protein/SAM-dependent methyltransferase